MGMFDDSQFWANVRREHRAQQDDVREELVTCGCGREVEFGRMVQVYDDQGIYAGRHCSRACAESRYNLHMTRADYAEAGEQLDEDY